LVLGWLLVVLLLTVIIIPLLVFLPLFDIVLLSVVLVTVVLDVGDCLWGSFGWGLVIGDWDKGRRTHLQGQGNEGAGFLILLSILILRVGRIG